MSIRTIKAKPKGGNEVPLLCPGDRLTQPEFHRRYEAYPDDTKFELIRGIVYMMAPAGFEHGKSGYDITTVLGVYEAATPGVLGATGPTVILGEASEPEPDVVLLVAPDCGGRTRLKRIGKKNYIKGPPELIIEVSHSTVLLDLRSKRADYRRGGVLEYVVICLDDRTIRWFDLAQNEELELGGGGILRSRAFPGLWIDSEALLHRNPSRLMETVQKGIESSEHQQFVAKLAGQRREQAQVERKPSRTSRKSKRDKP